MKNSITVAAATLLFAGVSATTVNADTDFYAIDVFVGEAGQKNSADYAETISGTDTSKGIRLTAQLNRVIGIELGYTNFGEVSDSYNNQYSEDVTDYIESNAINVGVSARIPLGPTVSLVGRAGLARWELDYTETNSAFLDDYKDGDKGVDGYVGVGLRFDLEENFRVGIEYTGLGYKASLGSANTDHIINNLAISAGFTF